MTHFNISVTVKRRNFEKNSKERIMLARCWNSLYEYYLPDIRFTDSAWVFIGGPKVNSPLKKLVNEFPALTDSGASYHVFGANE